MTAGDYRLVISTGAEATSSGANQTLATADPLATALLDHGALSVEGAIDRDIEFFLLELPAGVLVTAAAQNHDKTWRACMQIGDGEVQVNKSCRMGTITEARPSFILWGDSHGTVIAPLVHKLAVEYGQSGVFAVSSDCPPLHEARVLNKKGVEHCYRFNRSVSRLLENEPSIKHVILSSN